MPMPKLIAYHPADFRLQKRGEWVIDGDERPLTEADANAVISAATSAEKMRELLIACREVGACDCDCLKKCDQPCSYCRTCDYLDSLASAPVGGKEGQEA